MYCPGCGSQNQSETKFCTRCGTNLLAVAEALTGGPNSDSQTEDRAAKLLKKYYTGRRDTVTGVALMIAGFMLMALLMAARVKPLGAFFIVGWLAVWGAIATALGLGKWIGTSGEMKALRFLTGRQLNSASATGVQQVVFAPDSVTDQTTRQLAKPEPAAAGESAAKSGNPQSA